MCESHIPEVRWPSGMSGTKIAYFLKNTNSLNGCQETAVCSFLRNGRGKLTENGSEGNILLFFHDLQVLFKFFANINDALIGNIIGIDNIGQFDK